MRGCLVVSRSYGRPGLAAAAEHAKRSGGVLVAARLDRVSRSVIDFAGLLSHAEREGWSVLVLDLPLDTTTAAGRFTALSMANAAEFGAPSDWRADQGRVGREEGSRRSAGQEAPNT
jgi:DNA invertase Pin-like site-specific DNA recombinase